VTGHSFHVKISLHRARQDGAARGRVLNQMSKQIRLMPSDLVLAALAVLIAAPLDHARAVERRGERSVQSVESRTHGEPIVAVVSLRKQQITVYDPNGWILRAPVSSGQKGRETPAGIFSVIQKNAEHYSNLYDDAYMPHMQRITWSGIALHGGPLPGYPASHGCVRMPFDFAARLFEATRLGLRVIVAPTDVAPIEIAHPSLLEPKTGAGAVALARAAEADEAARKADQARLAVGKASRESAQAMIPVRVAENLRVRLEAQMPAAETAPGFSPSADAKDQAESAKAQAIARIAELQAQLAAAKAELQPKLDALTRAREAAVLAEAARVAAVEAARQVARELEPVSLLVSRKTQRLYVRQAFEPIFDSPIKIMDPDRPIGTHLFTVMEAGKDTSMRWSVVSLNDGTIKGGPTTDSPIRGEPKPADPGSAKAALDRIVIPQDALDRIAGIAPRSSLIITDEPLSSETGKGTDFVVLLSGEPQGGIKTRRRAPASEFAYPYPRERLLNWRSPFGRTPFGW
jgi:hypothetical protein